MASYMHHCCFLKQKIVFQTSEQGSDSGFSDTVYFTRHSLVEKKKWPRYFSVKLQEEDSAGRKGQ